MHVRHLQIALAKHSTRFKIARLLVISFRVQAKAIPSFYPLDYVNIQTIIILFFTGIHSNAQHTEPENSIPICERAKIDLHCGHRYWTVFQRYLPRVVV